MRTEVPVTHSMDYSTKREGIPIVSIPLMNIDKHVILYEEDFNRLYSQNLDPRWHIVQGTVFERGKKRVAIARLIADAKKGERVFYKDRDPCNLRRTNLVRARGNSKTNAPDHLMVKNRPGKINQFNDTVSIKNIYDNPKHATKEMLL